MNISDKNLKNEERVSFALRALYSKYGYAQYKMSKFEEYDLYVRNKDFLISDGVITFTDTNGRLMALKPDVTLSIIKNCTEAEGTVQKMYYNENVYRVSGSTKSFREIMQVGLECIGDIDAYCISEVLLLAARSLMTISDEWVLDISHLGILNDVIDALCLDETAKREVIKCVGEKNLHEATRLCGDGEAADRIRALISTYGSVREVIPRLRDAGVSKAHIKELGDLTAALDMYGLSKNLRIDFSVVDDIKYYNGIVFKGYVHGVPTSVLSGGQYDNLMKRMGKKAGAIGFAVYLDLLEGLSSKSEKYDVDTLVIYDENEPAESVAQTVARISDTGASVVAQRRVPEKLRYKKLIKLSDGEVTVLEDNA
ncbi:MAG: ATP phosphoribosyltransferase regulatory subunit [Oscillospiraceae bacterium]|nr:ATP phosphoribosyltransferase regulatory subunit [Oscillospiraceae bacterium]